MYEKSDPLIKVVLLGGASVGKSSLLSVIIHDRHDAKIDHTIGLAFALKTLTLPNNMNVKLQIWDIAERGSSNPPSRSFVSPIICIVLDATNTRQDGNSKIEQVKKYQKQIQFMLESKGVVLVIDNKSDCSSAVRMSDDELSQLESLGIDRSHYIYASARLNQANDQPLINCLARFVQEYIDVNSISNNIIIDKTYESLSLQPVASQSTPLPFFSTAWWGSLFASEQQTHQFHGVNRIREQISQLSEHAATVILLEMYAHLLKGCSSEIRKEPFELSRGGGSNKLSFIDRRTQQEITLQHKYFFPHNVIPWLSICIPYVHYKKQLPVEYVLTSKYDLLQLFNSIVATASNLKPYCRRFPSTAEFYRQLPNFLIVQIGQHISPANALVSPSAAAIAAASMNR